MASLPHNLDAEQALLGALLFDNKILDRLGPLEESSFFDPVHGRIFAVARDRIKAGQLADPTTLKALTVEPGMVDLGGPAYLVRLMTAAAPFAPDAIDYAALVIELAQKRAIFRACQEAAHAAIEEGSNPAEIVRATETKLRALSLGSKGWTTLREAGREVVEDLRQPAPKGLHTGLAKMDKLLAGGLYAPDLVILAGRPAMGKTALADVLATNVASSGRTVAFFSMEMDPAQIAARVLSRRSTAAKAFSYSELRQPGNRPHPSDVAPLVERLPETLLIDPTGAQTLAGIEAQLRAMRAETGAVDMVLVDYLQLMREPGMKKENRTQELSEITAGLKGIAKRFHCPVVALSQLSRALENRADKTPQLSDLRESGSIEQDADIVLFVYREHYYLERNKPVPRADEDRSEFSTRLAKHEQRLKDTAHAFKLLSGKNRHGQGGIEDLYCDLAMDVISDEPPSLGPRGSMWVQDGPL